MNLKNAILIVFVAAIIPRFILAVSSQKALSHDAAEYEATALSILNDGIYGEDKTPTSFRPPLYPSFLALIYRIFGHSYLAVRVVQAILGALTCIVIYFIALELIDRNAALISGLLAAVNISFIKSTEHFLTELIATFLISLIVFSLIKLKRSSSLSKQAFVGLLAGLIALTRSETLFFLPFVYGVWLCLVCLKKYSLKVFLKNVSVTLCVFLSIISLWTFRNWRLHHAFVPITTSVGINLYSSYRPPQGKLFGFTANDDTVKLSGRLSSEVEQSKFLLKETFKFIRANLDKLPRLEFLKFAFFWSIFDWEIIGNGVYNFSFGFMLPFFVWGVVLGLKKRKHYLLIYAPILYFQITTLLLYGSPRFRIPCEPFIIIFSAIGIMYFFQKFSKKVIPGVALSVFLLTNVTIYFHSAVFKEYLKCVFVKFGLW